MFPNACKWTIMVCCLGLTLIVAHGAARANEFRLVPGASLKEEFNDNIFFSTGVKNSSFISTVSPKLSLINRTERFDAAIDASLGLLFYTEDSHLNSVDQNYHGRARYQFTPRFGLSGEAGYSRQTRPDSFLETTGQVTILGSKRQKYALTGDFTFTEKLAGTLGYNYEQTDYSDPTVASNVKTHGANLGLIYDLSQVLPMLKLRGNLGYNTNSYTGLTLDMYTGTIGFSYAFHELWTVQADAGAMFGHSAFTEQVIVAVPPPDFFAIQTENRTNDDLGWIASLTFSYKGEKDSADLNFLRAIQSAYGRSGAVERTAVTAELRRKFIYELSAALSGGYYENNSKQNQFALQVIDETTYRVAPSLRYEFTPDMNLDCYYEYTNVKYNLSKTDAQRNMVFIRFTMQYPLFE